MHQQSRQSDTYIHKCPERASRSAGKSNHSLPNKVINLQDLLKTKHLPLAHTNEKLVEDDAE